MKKEKAVVLLSGGLDSSVVLSIAIKNGFIPYCVSFDYGQRHKKELFYAKKQVFLQKVKFYKVFKIDFFGGSALTDNIEIPKNRYSSNIPNDIPVTYVPARNTIFLSYALGYSEYLQCRNIFIGVNIIDYSGYPDCRPEFISMFEKMANIATKQSVLGQKIKIHTPLLKMNKKEIIETGKKNNVDFKYTMSCYNPKNKINCGECDACLLRLNGFFEANIKDPTKYKKNV